MNLKLTDRQITGVCRELLAKDPDTSGRALRLALKQRFGASGKSDRVFAVWRALRSAAAGEGSRASEWLQRQLAELHARLRDEEIAHESAEQRALLSEAREVAHQDRWAHEIHTLRAEVRRLTAEEHRRVELEARVLELTRENTLLRTRLARLDAGN